MLYGAAIWFEDKVKIKEKLQQIQRRSLLGITKCYRTVAAKEALQILAGCVPVDLVANVEKRIYSLTHWAEEFEIEGESYNASNSYQSYKSNVLISEEPVITWDRKNEEEKWRVYTDVSKRENKVGCAVMLYKDKELIYENKFRL